MIKVENTRVSIVRAGWRAASRKSERVSGASLFDSCDHCSFPKKARSGKQQDLRRARRKQLGQAVVHKRAMLLVSARRRVLRSARRAASPLRRFEVARFNNRPRLDHARWNLGGGSDFDGRCLRISPVEFRFKLLNTPRHEYSSLRRVGCGSIRS